MSSIPTSLRLQRKMLEDKFPEASAKSWFLIFFPGEMAYSVVERKTIMDENPKVKQYVTVKGSKGEQWKCQIVYKGTKDECIIKQQKLGNLLDDKTDEEPPCKKRRETLKNDEKKGISDEGSSDEEDCEEESDQDEEQNELNRETEKVKALLAKKKKDSSSKEKEEDTKIAIPEKLLKELFDGVYKRLDTISNLLQQQLTAASNCAPSTPIQKKIADRVVAKEDSSPQSPSGGSSFNIIAADDFDNEEFIYNGTNLLHQVSAKAKKPKLYATALLSQLFNDKEMREGSVEPKEGATKKPALDQTKVELIKKCIKAKYGEKVLERSWSEIRTSLNQKCLDKLKAFRKASASVAEESD